jgi:hypothetical protein
VRYGSPAAAELQTHIVPMESVSLCVDEKLTAFLELQRITRNGSD